MPDNLRERFAERFSAARSRTLQMFDLAAESILHLSPGFGFRPILWHLAHIGTFEEFWILNQIAGLKSINPRFQAIFDPIRTPRESSTNLPSKAEMLAYLQRVREDALKVLNDYNFASSDPLRRDGYVFELVLQHELQHHETLAYLFHLISPSLKKSQSPISKAQSLNGNQRPKTIDHRPNNEIEIPAGEHTFGADGSAFAYDNEMPPHRKFIPAFRLDRYLTTNAEFAEFIAADGYERRELWTQGGWNFKQKEQWQSPLYWTNAGGAWQIRTMFGEQPLSDIADHPVYGISYYEAEAYARFRGKRLPTEFEWEKACSIADCGLRIADLQDKKDDEINSLDNPQSAIRNPQSNYGFHYWQTTPVGYFGEEGLADMQGNLWEWTSSEFAPYPDFQAFPYDEYSKTWFDGEHKVLRGGSWATSPEILRSTFRNFFRCHFRIAFAGIRLAAD